MYIKKLKIGNVELKNNVVLAPMAGITDLPFREICKKYGDPGLVVSEMVSSKALFYGDEKTKKLLDTNEDEKPLSIQIFGSDPEIMAQGAKIVENIADIIDINMGCPAPKVVKNGDGSKLLQNLELVEEIVKKVKRSVKKPVTVKIRAGWNMENIIAVEAARKIENAGADAITIHGRTREQYYSGNVNLDVIKAVKSSVSIPVIGNGDIKNWKDMEKMFEYTDVDGVMIGRANLGAPWITKKIIAEIQGKKLMEISNMEKLKIIKEHINLAIEEKGEYIAIREMRKHICWYLKNLPNSSEIRDIINRMDNKKDVEQCLEEYFQSI